MDYPYIRAWCRFMRSADYYTQQELQRARRQNAPVDAIYSVGSVEWATLSDITSANSREVVERIAKEYA